MYKVLPSYAIAAKVKTEIWWADLVDNSTTVHAYLQR